MKTFWSKVISDLLPLNFRISEEMLNEETIKCHEQVILKNEKANNNFHIYHAFSRVYVFLKKLGLK